MSTSKSSARARGVVVTDSELRVTLVDGRTLIAPLAWFPKLLHAAPEMRARWELLGDGEGIHWPEADEDLSIAGLLAGTQAPGSKDRGAA